jgi:hypothetical protein
MFQLSGKLPAASGLTMSWVMRLRNIIDIK